MAAAQPEYGRPNPKAPKEFFQFAFLIGGLVVTETVFTLNGVGRFVVDAVAHRDYPVVQALVFVIALGFVIVNLLIDLTYAWFDPRIRYR